MKITKRRLRRIIREACGDSIPAEPINAEPDLGIPVADVATESPCPYGTADKLKASGMGDSEVLAWVNTLLSSFLSEGEFSYTGDVEELAGDEAFGVGYEAGSRGL